MLRQEGDEVIVQLLQGPSFKDMVSEQITLGKDAYVFCRYPGGIESF